MKFKKYFKTFALSLFIVATAIVAQAQNFPAPRENRLLNGTRILVWNDPKTDKVSVKIRIHSGSAFDPLGKEGTLQLLSDVLFPIEQTREFFTEDLNGSFEITTNYDFIQIDASSDADKFLNILETLAPAVTNPQINKESTERVRAALAARVRELEKNPAYVADQVVAKRLLGNFPYGRPQLGSSESLGKIDFADLLFARERFLTADNATIAISGKVNQDFAFRAVKRLFGGWLKADKKIPATFAQPAAPSSDNNFVEFPTAETAELRQAVRGLSRNDKDYAASLIVQKILAERFQTALNGSVQGKTFVRNDAHLLPGLMIFGGSVSGANAKTFTENAHKADFFKPLTAAEFEKAKTQVLSEMNAAVSTTPKLVDVWLDTETFKLAPLAEQMKTAAGTTLADGERILERFFRNAKFAQVFLADASVIKEMTAAK